jgi:steroid delta-isomerase
MTKLSEEHIAAVMQQYVDAISAGDLDAIVALYSEDAVVEDPVGSDPHRGHAAIREFYKMGVASLDKMVLEGKVRARERWGACAMLAYPKGAEGKMVIETIDVMVFDDEGKIVSMTAYWGNGNIRTL